MPMVQIHMLEGRTREQKKKLLESITQAVTESLDVSVSSVRVWLNEFPADQFMAAGTLWSERDEEEAK